MNNNTASNHPVISPEMAIQIEEFQRIYEKGTIPEVLSTFKDYYAKHNHADEDTRIGMINTLNHIQDLCTSIVSAAPTLPPS